MFSRKQWRSTNILITQVIRYSSILKQKGKTTDAPTASFISSILECTPNRASKLLENNKPILEINRKDLTNTVAFLKGIYQVKEIETKPMILYVNSATLQNRLTVLNECGFKNIPISILIKYITVMNRDVKSLKLQKILPSDTDVQKNLENIFNSDISIKLNEKLDDQLLLKIFREKILSEYLREKLQLTPSQLENQWKIYGRMRHKSFSSIIKMIKILQEDLNFSIERIIKNGYLVYGDPDNLKDLLQQIPKIGNEDFKEILHRRPKIIMSSCESVKNTIEHIKKFGIPETSILKCLEILTLGSDTVYERLTHINSINELRPLTCNPRILRLVHYHNKALKRLEYLNNMKVKCASLHILSCDSDSFIKFAREGTDRNKGKDVVVYLANIFKTKDSLIRNTLSKHVNWSHVPVLQLKECFDFLKAHKFSDNDIYENIHILLYPSFKIEEKLKMLRSDDFYKDLQINTSYTYISYKKILTLCLYLLELDFHFTGDGIWTDQHSVSVENFNNFIPDFLENTRKNYKYGAKPSISSLKAEVLL